MGLSPLARGNPGGQVLTRLAQVAKKRHGVHLEHRKPLRHRQLRGFAGNAMELSSPKGRLMAMSTTALATLTDEQRATIERTTRIVPIDIPTIETAGGSVRCMLAGILLERRRRPAGSKAAATRP